MGIYNAFEYGSGVLYGEAPRLEFSAYPFRAQAITYSTAVLDWTIPEGDYDSLRVVRSLEGYPETQEDGIIVYEWNSTSGVPVEASFVDGETPNPPITTGRFVYYRIWVLKTSTLTWKLAGDALALVPSRHDSVLPSGDTLVPIENKLLDLLPRVYTSKSQSPLDEVDTESDLAVFLDGFSFLLDSLLTYVDLLLPEDGGRYVHPDIIFLQSLQLGLLPEPYIATKQQRRLIREALYIYQRKGTLVGLGAFIESFTGYAPDVTASPNVMLTPQDSSFTNGVGFWQAIGDVAIEAINTELTVSENTEPLATDYQYVGKVTVNQIGSKVTSGNDDPIRKGTPVTAGTPYTFSAYAKTNEALGMGLYGYVTWYDEYGTVIRTDPPLTYTQDAQIIPQGSWTKFEFTGRAPGSVLRIISYNISSNVATLSFGQLNTFVPGETVIIEGISDDFDGQYIIDNVGINSIVVTTAEDDVAETGTDATATEANPVLIGPLGTTDAADVYPVNGDVALTPSTGGVGVMDVTFDPSVFNSLNPLSNYLSAGDYLLIQGVNSTVDYGVHKILTSNFPFALDTDFNTAIGTGFFNSSTGNPFVRSIALQSDGKILVGGAFSNFNGTSRGRLVRLNSNGTEDTAFNNTLGSGFNNNVNSILIQSDGKILVGGFFNAFNSLTRKFLVRLNADGTEDTAFYSNLGSGFNNWVRSATLQSDGKILVGGNFTDLDGNTRNGLVRLNADGTEDTAFYSNLGSGFNSAVHSVAVQSDGKILVGGQFTEFNGNTRNRLVRLNVDGTEDTSFYNSLGNAFNDTVYSIVVQADEKILVGGEFTEFWFIGSNKNRLVRLNADGTEDTAFYNNLGTGFNTAVYSIAVQSDGNILVGGTFFEFNESTRRRFVILNADGTENTDSYNTLNSNFNSSIFSIVVTSDDTVFLGGMFDEFNFDIDAKYLAKINQAKFNLASMVYYDINDLYTSGGAVTGATGFAKKVDTAATAAITTPAVYAGFETIFLTTGTLYLDMVQMAALGTVGFHEARGVEVFLNGSKTNYLTNPSFDPDTLSEWDITAVNWEAVDEDVVEVTGTGHVLEVDTTALGLTSISNTTGQVPSGEFFSASIYGKTELTGQTEDMAITITVVDAVTTDVVATVTTPIQINDEWQRFSTRLFVEPSEDPSTILVANLTIAGVTTGNVIYLDKAQLEASFNPTDYFDGSLPASYGAVWEGDAHESASHLYPNLAQKTTRLTQELEKYTTVNQPYVIQWHGNGLRKSNLY